MFACCMSQWRTSSTKMTATLFYGSARLNVRDFANFRKNFVADHAQSLEQQIRFRSLFAGWFSRRVGQASKISGIRNDWHVLHWLIWAADPRLLQIQCLMQLYGPVLVGQAQTWHSADSRDATGSLFWEGNKPFVRRNVNFLGWNKCLWMTEKV